MDKFIGCDWGTTSLRLRIVEIETQNILAEVTSQHGIAATYALWKNSSSERFLYFRNILLENIKKLSSQCTYSLNDLPIIISGMASSGIGMMELDYKMLPVKIEGSDLLTEIIESANDFKHRMIIVSGLKSDNDVMRGEETIIAGCEITNTAGEQSFILPGTHSKHIVVKNAMVTDFKTYMTGELFDLLSTKSILSGSVEKENQAAEKINSSFENGVEQGACGNFLHDIFHVRTNRIFNKLSPLENYYYLSGLLIGTELKDIMNKNYSAITLVSDEKFFPLYFEALHILKVNKNVRCIAADKALIKGQSIIYKLYQ